MASTSASRWRYDVFLSFRGKDIRKGFTGHLYAALCRSGINTFVDEYKIYDGIKIGEASLKGITESRLSLVLLSKDYASSVWCLEELVQILKCKKPDDVWPIFYDIDPSHVEEIKGSYELAFAKHEQRFKEEITKEWKAALQQVSYLKGLDLQKHLDGHEAHNIDHIVTEISRILDQTPLSVAIHPVDLHSRADQVISLIADEVEDIRIVGIYGMGGIGKSTVAKEVFNFLFQKYDCSCFLANVREVSKSKGTTYLQRQLLSETLKKKHGKIDDVDIGLNLIIQSLSQKKVLLVLDDVDELKQIHQILGNWGWLLPGSRVIITTRMKNFLQSSNDIYQQYVQYEVVELSDSNSLKLLSLHAFGKNQPPNGFMDCAKKMAHYAGGVPLALEVLGSSLCGQSVEVWNSRLEKLKVIANDDIHSKLKISYDSLSDTEQFIFLDIACFFIGYDKHYVTSILDGCNFFPMDGIDTLLRRCLLNIGSDNKLLMHDLIRDMGRETVRQEHATDPGERSRLWHPEDVIDVLTHKMGTKAVEGLVLNIPGAKHSWSIKTFKKMKMLRLFQLNNVLLTGSYGYMSNKLRWLCWREFPMDSIPCELRLENLIALDMRYSSLKQFSEETKSLKNLRFLNLNRSHKLSETPNFQSCQNLEKLTFKECISLEKIHETIEVLTNLLFLNFQDCKNLKKLPKSIGGLIALEKLNMSGCSKLEELPESIGLLTNLSFINLQDCENLNNLPESTSDLKSLRDLNISGCSRLEALPKSIGCLSCLTLLNLHDCKNLKNLPASIGDLISLEMLDMSDCSNLEDLPESAGCFTSLRFWYLQGCKNVKSFPRNICGLRSLRELNMSGCSEIKELPEDLGNLNSLVVLNLDGTAISTLPESIENLKELKSLSLRECQFVFSPRKYPCIISFLPCSLKELNISYCKLLDGVIPQDVDLPLLEDLKLCGNGFTSLPASIGSLPKLVALSLNDCRGLRSIPQLHSGLKSLYANNCPSLESIDLSKCSDTNNLEVDGCLNLREIGGYFNLEPLGDEILGKLFGSNSSSMKDSITNDHVRKIDSLTQTNKRFPLQALSERGMHSIFLPGSWMPTWFSHQSEGDVVSIQVPPLSPGSKIIGIVTCVIYAWKRSCKSWFFFPNITITNTTKMFYWPYTPFITFLSSDIEQDISWLCYWMFDYRSKGTDTLDHSWRFKDEMEEGDELEFSFDVGSGIEAKKCGIHLLYQPPAQTSQSDNLAIISYAASRHHNTFHESRPRTLTVDCNQELKTSKDASAPHDVEYKQWSKRRLQRMQSMIAITDANVAWNNKL